MLVIFNIMLVLKYIKMKRKKNEKKLTEAKPTTKLNDNSCRELNYLHGAVVTLKFG